MYTKPITILIFLSVVIGLSGQKTINLSLTAGMSSHGGDANSWGRHGLGILHNNKMAFGLNISTPFSESIDLRLQYRNTQIEGDDSDLIDKEKWGPQHAMRGYMYRSSINELGLVLKYSLLKRKINRKSKNKSNRNQVQRKWTPYLTGGFAYAFVSDDENMRAWTNPPQNKINDVLLDQASGATGGFQIPVGLGIRFYLVDKIFADVFYSARLPISDYLDGISEAGNPEKNDAYQFYGVILGVPISKNLVDTDGDGVPDNEDECPDRAGNRLLFGCPDFDDDGIMDDYDNCPQLPGPARSFGCPDRDKDGIPDNRDKCPDQAGEADNDGCPRL